MEKIKWVMNEMPKGEGTEQELMSVDEVAKARDFHRSFPQYSDTPLAELKGMEKDEVIRVTAENARRLYRL